MIQDLFKSMFYGTVTGTLILLIVISILLNLNKFGDMITVIINAATASLLFGILVISYDNINTIYWFLSSCNLLAIIIYIVLMIVNLNKWCIEKYKIDL